MQFAVLVTASPVTVVLIPVMNAFNFLEGVIPDIKPFTVDPLLTTLDRFLRLDHEPWQVPHPQLGPPLVIDVFSSLYVTR